MPESHLADIVSEIRLNYMPLCPESPFIVTVIPASDDSPPQAYSLDPIQARSFLQGLQELVDAHDIMMRYVEKPQKTDRE